MGEYLAKDTTGKYHPFIIEGTTPSPDEMSRIKAHLSGKQAEETIDGNEPQAATGPAAQVSADPNAVGFGTNMARHLERAGKATLGGTADLLGMGLSSFDPANKELQQQAEDVHGYAAKTRAEGDAIQTTDRGFFDEPTWGGKLTSLAGTMVESAPSMAAATVAGMVTKNPGAAWATGALFSLPQAMDSNVRRQIQEHGHVTDWNKAGISAAGQAAFENLPDIMLAKVAGFFPKAASKVAARTTIDTALKKAWTKIYEKTGKGMVEGAFTNFVEEATQAGMERWQADLPLLDDNAKQEYLENGLVGGILGTALGGVAGVTGGVRDATDTHSVDKYVERKAEHVSAMKAAIEDADADAAAARAERTPTSAPTYETKAAPPTEEDFSAPTAEAAAPVADSEERLPPGLRETSVPKELTGETPSAPSAPSAEPDRAVQEAWLADRGLSFKTLPTASKLDRADFENLWPTAAPASIPPAPPGKVTKRVEIAPATSAAPITPAPTVSPFGETDYRKAIDTLKGAGTLSEDKVAKALKIKKPEARSLLDEFIKRGDAKATGREGKYARLITPVASPATPGPTTSRDYSIKPVIPTNHAPFFAEMNGKRRSAKNFKTEEEARAWIAGNVPKSQQKSVSVAADPSSVKHGIYETVTDAKGTSENLVSSHDTEIDAKEKLKELDPAYSAITNEKTRATPEEKRTEVERDVATELGPYKIMQTLVDRMAGKDRARVEVVGRIDDAYVASKGNPNGPGNAIVEGVFIDMKDSKDAVRRIIALATDFTDPNLSQDEKNRRVAAVLNHEIIHAIINLKLLTPAELGALMKATTELKVPGKSYTWAQRAEARNPHLRKEGKIGALLEEGVAEMFRHYINDPSVFKGPERSALAKIAQFVRKLIGLGRKHDATQIMDAIFGGEIGARPENYGATNYGGVPARNAADVWYSLLKPDNAYLKSLRIVEQTKMASATGEQWLATMKNAGVKPEELWWQNIEGYLQSFNKPIPKQDLMNFIRSTPDVSIDFLNFDFPNPNVRVNIRAEDDHAEFGSAKKYANVPRYGHLKTKGGTDYAEATFFFTPKDGEPDYFHGHWSGEANVLAHARFKTVHETGADGISRKVLFIEEMQSDLHQEASKAGGYYSETLRNEANDLHLDYENAAQEYDDHYRTIREEKNRLRNRIDVDRSVFDRLMQERRGLRRNGADNSNHIHHYLFRENTNKIDKLEKEMEGPKARHAQLSDELKVLRDKVNQKRAAWNAVDSRMRIPNAPYRTSWEDFVIRRMIRHAAEHGFDAVAWHGEPESVAATEQWPGITEEFAENTPPVETESWRPLSESERGTKSYKTHGDTNVTSIINRYTEKLPRIVRALAQKFGAYLDINDASPTEAAPAKAKGRSYIPPELNGADAIEDAFPERQSIARLIDKLEKKSFNEVIHMTPAEVAGHEKLLGQLRKSYQIALNQREFKPASAFFKAGLIEEDMTGDFGADFKSEPLRKALFWADGSNTWSDTKDFFDGKAVGQAFPFKHYRLDLNTAMKESVVRGDQPKYSMLPEAMAKIEADPRFEQWFYGSVVTDANGRPKVLYHGSRAEQNYDRFKMLTHFGTLGAAEDRLDARGGIMPVASGQTIGEMMGIPKDQIASWWKALPYDEYDRLYKVFYANQEAIKADKARIYPVFLNLRRPLKIIDDGSQHDAFAYGLQMKDAGVLSEKQFQRIMQRRYDHNNNITEHGEQEALHDIVEALDKAGYDGFEYTNIGEDKGSTSYVTLFSHQAKSIYNKGYWGEDEPDMMYSKLEERGRDLWQNDDKFKSWFSGSKAVDKNGDPYLVFHGRGQDFDAFDQAFSGKATNHPTAGLGFFFTADPGVANDFTKLEIDENTWPPEVNYGQGSNVIPTFLSIKNPYQMETHQFTKLVREAGWGTDPDLVAKAKEKVALVRRTLMENGHDGILIKGDPRAGGTEYGADAWVAFHPNQIKSALSTEFSAESDSFKYSKMEEPKYSATAPFASRVPLAPVPDALDALLQKTTNDNLAPALQRFVQRIGGKALALKMGFHPDPYIEAGIIQLQDRMQPLGKLIDRLRKGGGFITNENDPYLQQALMSGQVTDDIENMERLHYDPLSKALHDLPVTMRDAEELKNLNQVTELIMKEYPDHRVAMAETYLYAQHALERNAEMGKRNAKFRLGTEQQQSGSGMSDFEAQAILNWFQSKPFSAKFNSETQPSIRTHYRKLIAATKAIRYNGDLTPDFAAMIDPATGTSVDVYKDYAPLRGFLHDHPNSAHDDNMFAAARTGLGFNIRGKEDPSAAGRASTSLGGTTYRSLGTNLLAGAVLQNQEALVRAAKNKVDLAFYKMINDNPAIMPMVANVLPAVPTKWAYNSSTGHVQQMPDPMALNGPDILKFKLGGKQMYIRIHDPRIAKAMGANPTLGGDGLGHAVLRGMRSFNKFMAMMVTSLNPEFVVSNVERDMISALVNMSEYETPGLKAKVTSSLLPAFKGIRAAVRDGDRTSPMAQAYWEFKAHGGATSFQGLATLEDSITRVNKAMQIDGGSSLAKTMIPFKAIHNFLEDYNLAVENSTRLAVYVTLRDHYLSKTANPSDPAQITRAKEQAAFSAKRKTVDFNMGGEMKPVLSAMYMFYNASMQGTMALINPLIRSRQMKKTWATVVTAGVVSELLNSLISPEDDDGKKIYDSIPDYILEHNMVFIDPFGISDRGYFKIPMPYGYNAIFNFGRATAGALRGKYTPGEALNSAFGGVWNSFNPLGETNSWMNYVAPTVLDPFVDLSRNEDYTGAPIMPAASPYGPSEVASQRYWNNTSPAAITIADWLSRLTGRKGDFLPGYAEVSPNQIGYVYETLAGGLGSTVARAYQMVAPEALLGKGTLLKMASGDMSEVEANDIPFVRKVYGSITTKNDLQNYIKSRDEVLLVRAALKDAIKEGNSALAKSIREKYPEELKINGRINAIENARKKKSSQIKKIRDNDHIPDDKKQEMIKRLKQQQDHLVGIANRVMVDL